MPQAPKDVPEVDLNTLDQENPISTSTDESIGTYIQSDPLNRIMVWSVVPSVQLFLDETVEPLSGCDCIALDLRSRCCKD